MTQFVGSSAWFIKFNPNTTIKNKKFQHIDSVPVNQISVAVLGGALTTDVAKALGYMEHLYPVVQAGGADVNLYSVIYNFGSVDPMLVKAQLFRQAGYKLALDSDVSIARKKEESLRDMNQNEPIIGYIQDIYDTFIAPRLVVGDGAQTARNMRNLIFYTHCHGGVALGALIQYAKIEMKTCGMTDAEISNALRNIVAIQHNPTGPLKDKSISALSFISASDDTLDYHDNMSAKLKGRHDLQPAFLGAEYGNVFVAGRLKVRAGTEHGFSDGFKTEPDNLTDNGKIIFTAQQNALIGAIRAASKGEPIATPEQMVSGRGIDFDKMQQNGNAFLKSINQR